MPRRKFTDQEIAELISYVDKRIAEGVRPSVACREFAVNNRYDDKVYYTKWYKLTQSKGESNMNKIQKAYEALKQAIKEEGFDPNITVWIHSHTNPHMSMEKAKELLDGYKINVDTKLYDTEGVDLVEYVDDGCSGFRIAANRKPTKEKHEWLLID